MRSLMVGESDFMVGDRDDPPHSDRYHDQQGQGNWAVNRIETLAEFTDFKRYPMAETGASQPWAAKPSRAASVGASASTGSKG